MAKEDPPGTEKSAQIHPTVAEHAIETGNAVLMSASLPQTGDISSTVIVVTDENGLSKRYQSNAQHAAAAQLHGWTLHDPSDSMRLTRAAYLAALKAAEAPVKHHDRHSYEPHAQAASPYLPKKDAK